MAKMMKPDEDDPEYDVEAEDAGDYDDLEDDADAGSGDEGDAEAETNWTVAAEQAFEAAHKKTASS